MPNPAASDPYEVVLSDLRAQRERIGHAIAALEALRGNQPTAPAPTPAQGPFTGMSIHEAAKAVLAEAGKPLGNVDITTRILDGGLEMKSADPVNTVGAVLTRRAAASSDLVKVGRGVWALPEWSEEATPVSAPAPPPGWGPPSPEPAKPSQMSGWPVPDDWGRAIKSN